MKVEGVTSMMQVRETQPVEEKAYSTSQDRITSINILGFHTLAH